MTCLSLESFSFIVTQPMGSSSSRLVTVCSISKNINNTIILLLVECGKIVYDISVKFDNCSLSKINRIVHVSSSNHEIMKVVANFDNNVARSVALILGVISIYTY